MILTLRLGIVAAAIAFFPSVASAQLGGLGGLGGVGDAIDEVVGNVNDAIDEGETGYEDNTDGDLDADVGTDGANLCLTLVGDCDDGGGLTVGVGTGGGGEGGGGGGTPGGAGPAPTLARAPNGGGAVAAPQICFYTLPNFGGQSFCLAAGFGMMPWLGEWDNRIASIRVDPGAAALVCESPELSGSCLMLSESVRQLIGVYRSWISSLQVM